MPPSKVSTPQERTNAVLDISVTEHMQFRTCRRRWMLETIRNLEPKAPSWAFAFGTGVHQALEKIHDPTKSQAHGARVKRAQSELDKWHAEVEQQAKRDGFSDDELLDDLYELANLGHMMVENYSLYDETSPIPLGDPIAIEGRFLKGIRTSMFNQPDGYPAKAAPTIDKSSGRLLVPIVDPTTKEPLPGRPMLSARIDLLTMRKSPYEGLCLVDHKTAAQAPNDRAIDFDDQVTGYCYAIWRWLGVAPRSVIYNVLIKKAPKEPRINQGNMLSAAKDQLTTPAMYREELKARNIMKRDGTVVNQSYAECYAGLLARGWDPFFRRYQPTRNESEILGFEERIMSEYEDMSVARDDERKQYPNLSTFICSNCHVGPICQAMNEGGDPEHVIESQYRVAEDRKA